MRHRVLYVALMVPVVALALTGCQSQADKYAKLDAGTIDQNLRGAVNGLTSVHAHSTLTSGSETTTLDVSVDSAGHCIASIAMGSESVSLIFTDPNTVYAQGNAAFWSGYVGVSAKAANLLGGQWVSGVPAANFASICSLKEVVAQFSAQTVAQDAPKVLGTTTAEGKPAVNLQVKTSTGTETIAVAASSPHYPLTVLSSDKTRGELFSQFNVPVTAAAPADAIDLSQIVASK